MRDNFITDIIDADLAAGRHSLVVTRFPPEPNGYLHIGHAKSICLNHGLAQRYGGRFHMRFDDTNPVAEDVEYVESIQHDIAWLLDGTGDGVRDRAAGKPWTQLYFASDVFEQMYRAAVTLIEKGLAYVDSQPSTAIREQRGGYDEPGVDSPFRNRSVAENLDLFQRMRAGEFADGAHVLRARIDMRHPNMILRDPVIYRIRHVHHHRTGDNWCIYPMYDFAHCLEDANEGITHSICTLEFESNRALYDWVLQGVGGWDPWPHQYEFARLALRYTVMSKRKLLQLVNDGLVNGWDDPRMPTLAGLRRRGVTAAAIRALCEMVGVAKNNSTVDIGKLEYCIRTDLERRSPRAMGVARPLKLTIRELPEDPPFSMAPLTVPWWPEGVEQADDAELVGQARSVPVSRTLWIERDDFQQAPEQGYRRLSPGACVRLRHLCVVRCESVQRDADGAVTELICVRVNDDDAKIGGTIHWLSAEHAVPATLLLYDRLFVAEHPDGDAEVDFKTHLNPQSLVVAKGAMVEPALADAAPGSHWQLERVGYFVRDAVQTDSLTFNRTATLRDTWGRKTGAARKSGRVIRTRVKDTGTHRDRDYDAERRAGDPRLYQRYQDHVASGIGQETAFTLTGSVVLDTLYAGALRSAGDPLLTATWVANVLPSTAAEVGVELAEVSGEAVGEVIGLVNDGKITRDAGKAVLSEALTTGHGALQIVQERGLFAVHDDDAIEAALDALFAAHPDEAARYLGGERKLMGFFMGAAMRALKGKGDPQLVKKALISRA